MQAFYKTLTERERSGMNVGALIWKRSRATARRLEELLAPELKEGEEMPDVELLQELMRRALDRRREELMEAGEELVDARQEVQQLTASTDDAIAGARRELIDLRTGFRSHFGTENAANFLGVRGSTASDPVPLQTQVNRAVARLRYSERPLPSPKSRLGVPDRGALADELAARSKTLSDSWLGLSLARKKVDQTLVIKDHALAAWNELFVRVTRVFEAVYLLIGCDDWARDVRPSGHRPGRTAVDVMRRRKKKPRKNKKRQQAVAAEEGGEAAAAATPTALVVQRQEPPPRPGKAAVSGLRRLFEALKPSRRVG